jgi:polar amino acid transport system substrate-binding protein
MRPNMEYGEPHKGFVIPILFSLSLAFSAQIHAREAIELTSLGSGVVEVSYVAISLVKEIYKQAGLDVRVTQFPASRSTIEVTEGRMDGEVARGAAYGEANPSLVRIEPPFIYLPTSAFFLKSAKVNFNSKDDLKNYSAGYVSGVAGDERLAKTLGFFEVETAVSREGLFRMLALGRFDVAIHDSSLGVSEIKRLGLKDVVDVEIFREPIYTYLSPKNRDLAPLIGGVIKKLSDSGELRRLQDRFTKEFKARSAAPVLPQ